MDEFEFTKIAGAVLAALLLIFGPRAIINMTLDQHQPEKPGYVLETKAAEGAAKEESGGESKEASAAFDPKQVVAALAKANVDNGKATFKKCGACHVAEKGKTPTVGPNLWGVVNRPKASYPGFGYSDAMKSKGGDWSFEELAKFIHDPKGDVPGTKMQFSGLKNPADEADVIAYLATLADTPVPLPK